MRAGPPGDRGAHHGLAPREERVPRTGAAGESQAHRGPPGDGGPGRAPRGVRSPACLARGGAGGRFEQPASSRSSGRGPSRGSGREGQGGAGCRREGARARRSVFQRPAGRETGLAAGAPSVLEALRELGRCLTVMRRVLEILRVDGSWARELRRRSPGRGVQPRWLGARRCSRIGALPPAGANARDRTPNRSGESSGGREPQESTDGRLRPGQVKESSQNGLPGGAKLRSGRAGVSPASPVFLGRGRHVRRAKARRGDRTSDRREPSSWFMSPGSALGRARVATSRREVVKAVVKIPRALRRRMSESEPARKQRPARAGTAPREGKALQGSSRDASGMEQGREASGATANGGVQKASSEPRASRNRREGQEP